VRLSISPARKPVVFEVRMNVEELECTLQHEKLFFMFSFSQNPNMHRMFGRHLGSVLNDEFGVSYDETANLTSGLLNRPFFV
jgi:hypothetical protein